MQTKQLFNQLLNLDNHWQVVSVDYDHQDLDKIIINIEYINNQAQHPKTNEMLSIYDHAPVRQWRHLDIMQYKTYLESKAKMVKLSP